jgi:hypothetical protein
MCCSQLRSLLPNNVRGVVESLKDSHRLEERRIFLKNLRAYPFDKDKLKDTTCN